MSLGKPYQTRAAATASSGIVKAVYRFRDAALVDEKKDDFGNASQSLYCELERAEDLVGLG